MSQLDSLTDVTRSLENVLDRCREEQSRLGYFAALYWHSTAALARALDADYFTQPVAMRRLGVVFYQRYLDALTAHWEGRWPIAQAWRVSFAAAKSGRAVVLQHLALGMNAHIELDLGIATADAIGCDGLPALAGDFVVMNEVLAGVAQEMLFDLGVIWPMFRWVDTMLHQADEIFARFLLAETRERAWRVARRFVRLDGHDRRRFVQRLDSRVARVSRRLWRPWPPLSWGLLPVRAGELQSVQRVIDQLVQVDVPPRALARVPRPIVPPR